MPTPKTTSREAIQDIAFHTHRSEDEVREIYERELADIETDARIKIFVSVFAKRRALERLKARALDSPRR
jgi:hypothetical protein